MFNNTHILVIGDAMIDTYLHGEIHRQSPEAPVPIVDISVEDHRLGGAANVALNIQALGGKVSLLSKIGDDALGEKMLELLSHKNLDISGIHKFPSHITTQKTRIYNLNEYVLRYDREKIQILTSEEEQKVLSSFKKIIAENTIHGVLFQDYNKGFLTKNIINEIVALCNKAGIQTTVDPKRENFFEYQNVSLFKPNLVETNDALGIKIDPTSIEQLESAAKKLCLRLNCQKVLITLSEHGVYLYNGASHHCAVYPRKILDVSGAGDSVISVASLCLALNMDDERMMKIANLAGGMVCEKKGVAELTFDELSREMRLHQIEE